jgi:hypothetical protein
MTGDDQVPSPASMTALTTADTILLWDPANQTVIANIVGTWLAPQG